MFNQIVSDMMGGDATCVLFLQQLMGYCCTGEFPSKERMFMIFYGPKGAGGKSLLLNVCLKAILGDSLVQGNIYLVCERIGALYGSDAGDKEARLAYKLKWARTAVFSELLDNSKAKGNTLKNLTGENEILVR